MNFALVLQVIGFLATNKDTIKMIIAGIEEMIPDAPGSSKAGAVKGFIGEALGVGDKIDAVWPMVQPLFNLVVAMVKGPKQ